MQYRIQLPLLILRKSKGIRQKFVALGYNRAFNTKGNSYVCVPQLLKLTLRRLMSCIYMEHPFLMFLDHTQRRSTVGRPPLDE